MVPFYYPSPHQIFFMLEVAGATPKIHLFEFGGKKEAGIQNFTPPPKKISMNIVLFFSIGS